MSDKCSRWRRRMAEQGRCPHCGKPCAPYYECHNRRFSKRINRVLLILEDCGALRREWKGRGHSVLWLSAGKDSGYVGKVSGRSGDKRLLPKIRDKPQTDEDLESIFIAILRDAGKPMTEQEISTEFAKQRLSKSRRTVELLT